MAPPSSAGSKRGGKRKTKRQLEEETARAEARLKADLEAAEARRKDEEKQEILAALNDEFQSIRVKCTNELLEKFNDALRKAEGRTVARQQKQSWDRYMDQSGLPDTNSRQEIASFLMHQSEKEMSWEQLSATREKVNSLKNEMLHLSLDHEHKLDVYRLATDELNAMMAKLADKFSILLLSQKEKFLNSTVDFEEYFEMEDFRVYIWANILKNPRKRLIEAPRDIKIELKKEHASEDLALRLIWSADDKYTVKFPSFDRSFEKDLISEPEQETNEDEDLVSQKGEENNLPDENIKEVDEKVELESNHSSLDDARPLSAPLLEVDETQEDETEGKVGFGGVWRIEYLGLPPSPKMLGEWLVSSDYKVLDHLNQENESFEITLPVVNCPRYFSLLKWNGVKWSSEGIKIQNVENGLVSFSTASLGVFQCFQKRFNDGNVFDSWMIRPNHDHIELTIIQNNLPHVFSVRDDGKLRLRRNDKHVNEDYEELRELVSTLRAKKLNILPVEESKQVLAFLDKEEDVLENAYLNIAHASSKGVIRDSEFNQDQESSTLVVNLNDELCVISSEKFFIAEKNYIKPPCPVKSEINEEDEGYAEAIASFESATEEWKHRIAREAASFTPDFTVPRLGCKILPTMAQLIDCNDLEFSEQNFCIYKLCKILMLLNL